MRLLIAIVAFTCCVSLHAERVKDVAEVSGVRGNQLIGYGLVVGLDGTGDDSPFTAQGIRNMLLQLGVTLPPNGGATSRNVAGVIVHAELPAFARPGQRIDVTVSTLGSADSLRGGSLLMTPLKAVDGQVYAVAQGNVIVDLGNWGSGSLNWVAGTKADVWHLGRHPNRLPNQPHGLRAWRLSVFRLSAPWGAVECHYFAA